MVPLMSVWRNFFLGSEPTKGVWPLRMDRHPLGQADRQGGDGQDGHRHPRHRTTRWHPLGGERQSVAIARAVYFGAKVLILDEPTSALGVKQSGVVLRYIVEAAKRGLGVIFITHNPSHAYPVGDRFLILNRGQSMGNFAKDEITQPELTQLMAGGAELEQLQHDLETAMAGAGASTAGTDASPADEA